MTLVPGGTAFVPTDQKLDELKALADEICGPVYEDGIYHYCADKGLI